MSGIRLLRSTVAIHHVYCGEQDEARAAGERHEAGGMSTDDQHRDAPVSYLSRRSGSIRRSDDSEERERNRPEFLFDVLFLFCVASSRPRGAAGLYFCFCIGLFIY